MSMNHHHHHSNNNDDATESSIYDLDHAPAPPPPPPPVSSSSRLRSPASISPRPNGRKSSNSSSSSIVGYRMIPPGEPVVSFPPTAAPSHMTRRRLSSYSSTTTSIPIVGGSYTYGGGHQQHATTNRQRSYSSSAVSAPFSSSSTMAPPHLAHVRSFPPPRAVSVEAPPTQHHDRHHPNSSTRSMTDRSSPPDLLYSPGPLIRRIVEETKGPLLEEEDQFDDVAASPKNTLLPTTDSGYESELFQDGKDRTYDDNNFNNDVDDDDDRLMMMSSSSTNVEPPSDVSPIPWSPTVLYHQDSSGTRHHHHQEEEENESVSQHGNNDATPVTMLCGCLPLPRLLAKRRISWDRVASFVAAWSPCFVCFRMEYSTYRTVLFRLHILCGIMALVQLTVSSFHFAVLYMKSIVDRNIPTETVIEVKNEADNRFEVFTNTWNLNGPVILLGTIALFVVFVVASTVRGIRDVNLKGAIRYYWLILWIAPLQAYWAVSMFDYFHVTQVWVKFWWRDATMAWFRYKFCDPRETYNTLCTVPLLSRPEKEMEWCQMNFGATNCTLIRDDAEAATTRFLYSFYSGVSVWTIFFMLALFLVMKTLESIITSPLVQKSRESSIPTWLMLPSAGCFICGTLFTYSPSSILNVRYEAVTNLRWIAPMFMIAGGLFFVLAFISWLLWTCPISQTSHKRYKLIGVTAFVLISFLMIVTMAAIFVACILESFFLDDIPDSARGQIACSIDQNGSCSFCPEDFELLNITKIDSFAPEDECPEWSTDDVKRVLQSQAKSGANLAVICVLYAIGAFRYGLTVRKHVIKYKIAYV